MIYINFVYSPSLIYFITSVVKYRKFLDGLRFAFSNATPLSEAHNDESRSTNFRYFIAVLIMNNYKEKKVLHPTTQATLCRRTYMKHPKRTSQRGSGNSAPSRLNDVLFIKTRSYNAFRQLKGDITSDFLHQFISI